MKIDADYLIMGSGVAGLFFALTAAEHGSVAVVTKRERRESNTQYAQGGIAAVIDERDSFASHVADTLLAGDGLCDGKLEGDRVGCSLGEVVGSRLGTELGTELGDYALQLSIAHHFP